MDKYINEYREKLRKLLVGIGIDHNELVKDFLKEKNLLQTLDRQRASDLIDLAHQTCAIHLSGEQEKLNEHYENLVLNYDIIKKEYGNVREVSNLIDPKYPLDDWGKDSQYWVKWLTQHQEKLFILQKCISYVEQDSKKTKRINWQKSEEALRRLIDALKENGLIEQKETEDIIKNFEIFGKESAETVPEPINWIGRISSLVYLIEKLAGLYLSEGKTFIRVGDIWEDTIYSNFLVNGKTPKNHMKQSSYKYKDNKTGKPRNSNVIDSIFDVLPYD